MAQGALIYRADVQLAHEPGQLWLQKRLQLTLHPSETPLRLTARLLAWCLLGEPGMAFTRGLSTRDEPDLWTLDEADRPQHWVEVGEPDPQRLRRAANQARRVTVLSYANAPNQWWQKNRKRLTALDRLQVLWVDGRQLLPLSRDLPRQFTWQVSIGEHESHVIDHHDRMSELEVRSLI